MPVIPEEDGLGSPQESFTQEHAMEAGANSPSAGSTQPGAQSAFSILRTPPDTSSTGPSSNGKTTTYQNAASSSNAVPEDDPKTD